MTALLECLDLFYKFNQLIVKSEPAIARPARPWAPALISCIRTCLMIPSSNYNLKIISCIILLKVRFYPSYLITIVLLAFQRGSALQHNYRITKYS